MSKRPFYKGISTRKQDKEEGSQTDREKHRQTRRFNPRTTHWMDPTSVGTQKAKCEASVPTVDTMWGA